MASNYIQTIAIWSGTTTGTSGSFSATAGDAILVYGSDFTAGSKTISFSGTGTYTVINPPGQFNDIELDSTALAANLSATAGSQTIAVTTSGTGDLAVGFAVEYSDVSAVTAAENSQSKPGAGAGAVLGVSVSVPTGSTLVAFAFDLDAGGTVVATGGTTRSSTTTSCVTDYAGAGAAIQPAFTGSAGASDHYIVVQFLLTPASVSGTAAITEGADTAAGVGTDSVAGTATITESADTVAGVGTDSVSGTAAITEGADVAAGTGTDAVSGTAAISEGHDTAVGAGTNSVSGTAAISEASDTASAAGSAGAVTGSKPAGDDTKRGRQKRRYGVRDGWRLLIFDTKEQADAAKAALSRPISPASKRSAPLRIRVTPAPAQVVDLPEMRKEATSYGLVERYDTLLAAKRFHDLARMTNDLRVHAMRREEEEIAIVLLHLH